MQLRRRHWVLPCVAALLTLLVACGAGGVTAPQQTVAAEILTGVNQARVSGTTCGGTYRPPVPRLALSSQLIQAAQAHSDDMRAMGTMTHTGSDGSQPNQRIARTGYQGNYWGENIAWGQTTEAAAVAAWLRSPPHCGAIMNPNFEEIGAARASNFWTLVFARPR